MQLSESTGRRVMTARKSVPALPSDNAELVGQFVQGCERSAERLFGQLAPAIQRTVSRLLAWPVEDEVDDVLQEVFLKAWTKRRQFRGDSNIKTWVTRIAINECRRVRRRRLVQLRWLGDSVTGRKSHDDSAESQVMRAENQEIVRNAICLLNSKLREVVVLYYLEEMKARQIAQLLGIRLGTVEVRLSRARKKLATLLGSDDQSSKS